jgi:hypothetical protein
MKRALWLVACLAACEANDDSNPVAADGGADPADSGVVEVPDAAPESTSAELIAAQIDCESENLNPPALAGRALEAGFALEGPAIASTTALYLLPGPTSRQRFAELIGPIFGAMNANEGLLAQATTYDDVCGVARTFTLWRDRAAMYEFVASDAHVAAVELMAELGHPGSVVTHWEVPAEAFPPSWDDALERALTAREVGP